MGSGRSGAGRQLPWSDSGTPVRAASPAPRCSARDIRAVAVIGRPPSPALRIGTFCAQWRRRHALIPQRPAGQPSERSSSRSRSRSTWRSVRSLMCRRSRSSMTAARWAVMILRWISSCSIRSWRRSAVSSGSSVARCCVRSSSHDSSLSMSSRWPGPVLAQPSDLGEASLVRGGPSHRRFVAVQLHAIPARPAHEPGQRQALPDERDDDHRERQQQDQVALREVTGSASAAASETAPRRPAQPTTQTSRFASRVHQRDLRRGEPGSGSRPRPRRGARPRRRR